MQHRPGPILIVDDDADIRMYLRILLEFEGYAVVEAEDGLAASDMLTAHPLIACMVLDLQMPRMGGRPVLDLLRHDSTWAQLPVIVMSAAIGAADTATTFGATAFLQKPFTAEALLAVVKRVYREDMD